MKENALRKKRQQNNFNLKGLKAMYKTVIEQLQEDFDAGRITPAEIAEELNETNSYCYEITEQTALYHIGRGLISYNSINNAKFVHIADYQSHAPILSSQNYDIRPATAEEVEMYNNGIYCYKIKE